MNLPHGFTACPVCGRAIRDNAEAARNHLARCDAFGNAR